jgi:outer membrane lipoprotein-sorting protein
MRPWPRVASECEPQCKATTVETRIRTAGLRTSAGTNEMKPIQGTTVPAASRHASRSSSLAAALFVVVFGLYGRAQSDDTATGSAAGLLDGLAIARRSDAALRAKTEHQVMTMTLENGRGQQRVRTLEGWSREISDDEEHRFSVFQTPSDVKDTTLLTYDYDNKDDDTWLYLPALKKVKRILSSNKTDDFMGSDFTYEDMENIDLDNWKYTLLGEESVEGVDCWKIESVPLTDQERSESGYTKVVAWISKADYLPRQVEFTDKKGRLSKKMTAGDVRIVAGDNPRARAHKITMVNFLSDHRTVLDIRDIQLDVEIPEKVFSQRNLKQ